MSRTSNMGCGTVVLEARWEKNINCGDWWGGEIEFCPTCREKWEKEYPQGWDGYPGDRCKHGVYTGGCGVDVMCAACECGD